MRQKALFTFRLLAAAAPLLTACAANISGDDGQDAVGVTEQELLSGTATLNATCSVQASVTSTQTLVGARMFSTATATEYMRLLAPNSTVKIVATAPSANSRYKIEYGQPGAIGWIHGDDLTLVYKLDSTLSTTRVNALALARTGMGFSYWWSNARWNKGGTTMVPNKNIGTCSGSCGGAVPCTHAPTPSTGTEYGADCSGFVSTIWGFPDQDPNTNPTDNGYATVNYSKDTNSSGTHYPWSTVTLADALAGDALVTYTDNTQHIWLAATKRNANFNFISYECQGCSTGCLNVTRKVKDSNTTWHAIRKSGW